MGRPHRQDRARATDEGESSAADRLPGVCEPRFDLREHLSALRLPNQEAPPTECGALIPRGVLSIPTLAALVAVVSFGASPWIVGPVWAATMAFLQWALIVQRREWKARYVVPVAAAETPGENARRTAGEPVDEATT